uniref:Reverse transcriptase domain-containing protein n=1 Tax=Tanacetum cinerariifolium TaxID=118510 RepID=A0A6L2MFG6_TANCI|nr:hypothetical protein [Tanacetum cinerariifolium]
MEVNADEIVIKSDSKEEMLTDIKETLGRLRVINLKLNLKKCSFGVEEGRFSGHIITKQGIKADHLKVKAISDLEPPKSVSEIQSLDKKKMFQWTTEADGAFQRMKELLEALPTVTALGNGKTLIVYLEDSKESIRLVLMEKRRKRRIAKWAIELREHEIEFRGRNSIIGQILADFLQKTPPMKDREIKDREAKRKEPEQENAWKLFTDGALSFDSFRAGLMLVNPEGK